MNFSDLMKKACDRHIAKLLTRIEERHTIPSDVSNAIKAQIRYIQEDAIKLEKKVRRENGENNNQ